MVVDIVVTRCKLVTVGLWGVVCLVEVLGG